MSNTQPTTIYMDATLRPNSSLSERGFLIVMSCVAGVSFIAGMAFMAAGSWPVIGFFGLDAILLYLCFRWSFRDQKEATHITITADRIALHHTKANGDTKEATLPSAFARIELDEPVTPNSHLRIEYGNTAYVIGRFLTVPERKSLAKALRAALISARSERYV